MTDLFALGVILFQLCTGVNPFHSASEHDELYSYIALSEQLKFWQAHEYQEGAPYSDSFKDLLTQMFAY